MAAFTGNSVVGQVIAGDGHLVSSGQSGVVSGPTSAASFGAVTAIALAPPQTKTVGAVGSAQAFGSLSFRVTLGSGGVLSAQAFGVVTIQTAIIRTVVGLGSAQSFGAPHVAISQKALVGGVASAQSFGAITLHWSQIVQVPGLPQQAGVRSIVGQVISGDGHLVGGSGLLFGFVSFRTTVTVQVAGLGSAQQFGTPHIAFWQPLPVPGLLSAQQFGVPDVFLVWVYDLDCIDLELESITCTSLDLVAVACDTAVLATGSETTLDLTASSTEDLDLQPAGCS